MHSSPHKAGAFISIDNRDPEMMAAGQSKKILARTRFERYKRIKPQTLSKLMKDYNFEDDDDRMFEEEDGGIMLKPHYNLFAEEKKEKTDDYELESTYSNKTTQSVASIFASNAEFYESIENKGKSKKFETMSVAPTEDLMSTTSSILLIDLRDKEDYKQSHIKGSINWPSPNIVRDKFLKIIWNYRNKEGKIIVIYHENEKLVIEAAELMVDKDFNNLYILTNGYDIFAEENPEFIQGVTVAPLSTFKKPVKSLTS